jgi:YggT family protein
MIIIAQLLQIVVWIVIADVILSWVQPNIHAPPRSWTRWFTEPLYRPIHQVLDPRKTGGLDLSPIILIFGISFIQRALYSAASPF